MANFNRVAGSYDFLKGLVFGKQLESATNFFLNEITSNSRVLIVGGGSGKILGSFDSFQRIKYLELSGAMVKKAKKVKSKAKIEFVEGDILEWNSNEVFDYIITPFILDCFTEKQLNLILPKLKNVLSKEGWWIQTDFYPKNTVHQLLIKIMYSFFKLSTDLKTKKLADFDSLFKKHKFILRRKALFYHSMVESKIYKQID